MTDHEQELGLPAAYFHKILHDDEDWAFVVKICAMMEAVCSKSLTKFLADDRLREPLDFLEFANPRCGKIALLRSLGILDTKHAEVLVGIAEMRNSYAHNVRHIGRNDLRSYLEEKKETRRRIGGVFSEQVVTNDGETLTRDEITLREPRRSVWMAAMRVVAALHFALEAKRLPTASTPHASDDRAASPAS